MQMIGAILGRDSIPRRPLLAANGPRRAGFDALMTRSAAASDPAPRKSLSSAPAADTAPFDDALATFRKEASMTRQERIRRDVVKAMELTEEAIDAMPPALQKDVEYRVAAEVARRMKVADGDTTRTPTPLV
jgi:hypothetical protein